MIEMREIKFRGISKETNEWVYGYYYHRVWLDGEHIIKGGEDGKKHNVYPETVGQYTGLTDKWYKEIYEGDKVSDKDRNEYEVFFENGRFMCFVCLVYFSSNPHLLNDLLANMHNDIEVIGTIHDGKYGLSEIEKKILESRIYSLRSVQDDMRKLGADKKGLDVNSVIACINDVICAINKIEGEGVKE